MAVHTIDVFSQLDCQELIDRMLATLSSANPVVLTHLQRYPSAFPANDTDIFEALIKASFSNGTVWKWLQPHLQALKGILFYYDIPKIASLSDPEVDILFQSQIRPLKIPSRIKITTKLRWVRDNASTFLQIQGRHRSVYDFISSNLGGRPPGSYYLRPNSSGLVRCFTHSPYRLKGIGLTICCEFFNNVGVDEFKPDVHTIRFLNRVALDRTKARVTEKPSDVRDIGHTISETLNQTRKFVDSCIWHFCAKGEGEICTENDPKCHLCWLTTKEPQLCKGFPSSVKITNNPLGAVKPSSTAIHSGQGQQSLPIRKKIRGVVESTWQSGEAFSRQELIKAVQGTYPNVKANEIMPADRSVNRLSGYHKAGGTWVKKDAYLFARDDGKFERYDPACHGSYQCVDDGNGYKKIISGGL